MQQSMVPVRLFHNSLSPQLFPCFSIQLSLTWAIVPSFPRHRAMALQLARDKVLTP